MSWLHYLSDPESLKPLLASGGYLLLAAIVFSETGLLLGFFLPGDSMLFVAGAYAAQADASVNIVILIPLLIMAAVAGNGTGYLIGSRVGTKLYARPNSRFFKRQHLIRTHDFYEKHGPKTIVLAQFVPIIRTFAPTVAGVAGMRYRTFATFNVVGAVCWISSMCTAGYFLGGIPVVKQHFEKVVLLIILVSLIPVILHWRREVRHS